MAEASGAPAKDDSPTGFNLQVVSPSASVSRPLVFPGIAASTTVRQLKEKIRDAVASRPADDQQRLIHRGRLLARDDETLENILGTEAVRSGEQQTLHLVLRDLTEHHPAASQASSLRDQSPAPGGQQRILNQQQPRPQQLPHIHHHPHHHQVHAAHAAHAAQAVQAAHAFPPGNRPLTAPIIQMPPFAGMAPLQFQHNGPFHAPGAADPTIHEQLASQAHRMMANMINQNQQRAATPVGGVRASSNPPPHGRDPTQIAAQLALQLAQNAQQQEALANQAEQITILLNNPVTNQPNRAAASQQFVNQGNNVLNHGQRLMAQHLVDQSQRERAAAGLHGIQDNGVANSQGQAGNAGGRNSPGIRQPVNVIREVMTPNGQLIRVTTTVNGQVVTTQNGQPMQAIPGRGPQQAGPQPANGLHSPRSEVGQGIQALTNAILGSASGAGPASIPNANTPIQPIAPGVTTSIFRNTSQHGSRAATPDPSQRAPNPGSGSAQPGAQRQAWQAQPEVYIMSSPTGPHALLLTNQGTYFTPPAVQQPPAHTIPHWPNDPITHSAPGYNAAGLRERHHRQSRRREQNQPQHGLPQPPADNNQANPVLNLPQHPRPPNAGAAGALAAIWPHIWLLFRLAAFVWWFTATDSSWSRWITVVLIAVGVFAVNTGLFNNIAHQAWDPFRRHLEGILLPGARHPPNDNAAPPPRQADGAAPVDNREPPPGAAPPPAGRVAPPPDPAAVAARLVARRQQNNASWVMDQIRRVERAGLLFLASIAPGVAERHIAHLEAQERTAAQERARREAEAAEATTRAQAQAGGGTDGAPAPAAEAVPGGGQEEQARGEARAADGQEQARGAEGAQREGPLIEV